MEYIMGVNPFAEVVEELDLSDENCNGEDKWFPYGPTCQVGDMNVPCFVGHSESGSISSELLAAMLKHMDDCQVFDCTDGIPPFLLLDGHGSRFELPFLEYANDAAHIWKVRIGVPYGMNIWQVGDSAEQNGSMV